MDRSKLVEYWNRISAPAAVWKVGSLPQASKYFNMESHIGVDCNLKFGQEGEKWRLWSWMQGSLNKYKNLAVKVGPEIQAQNGLKFVFRYPVNLRALHFVWLANESHPVYIKMRNKWLCWHNDMWVTVEDTMHEVHRPNNKILDDSFVATTFEVENKLQYYSKGWMLLLSGQFVAQSDEHNHIYKIILVLHDQ